MIITTDHTYPDADLQEAIKTTDLHNLIAAARATLRAHADGEDDPLYYLRDELQAQGHLPAELQSIHYQERR